MQLLSRDTASQPHICVPPPTPSPLRKHSQGEPTDTPTLEGTTSPCYTLSEPQANPALPSLSVQAGILACAGFQMLLPSLPSHLVLQAHIPLTTPLLRLPENAGPATLALS